MVWRFLPSVSRDEMVPSRCLAACSRIAPMCRPRAHVAPTHFFARVALKYPLSPHPSSRALHAHFLARPPRPHHPHTSSSCLRQSRHRARRPYTCTRARANLPHALIVLARRSCSRVSCLRVSCSCFALVPVTLFFLFAQQRVILCQSRLPRRAPIPIGRPIHVPGQARDVTRLASHMSPCVTSTEVSMVSFVGMFYTNHAVIRWDKM